MLILMSGVVRGKVLGLPFQIKVGIGAPSQVSDKLISDNTSSPAALLLKDRKGRLASILPFSNAMQRMRGVNKPN